ncbi:MAG TPA: M20/M25/M40 family metallo-hydrolase [Terriglobales bacterium]|nr:M20/M25/M40 family metallo-hydrolase [Terriglobales bacterium]
MLSRSRSLVLFLLVASLFSAAQSHKKDTRKPPKKSPAAAAQKDPLSDTQRVCARCLRANLEFLASDALRGRGSATPDERTAAEFAGAQLRQYGVEPAGDNGAFLQTGTIETPQLAAPPTLSFTALAGGQPVVLTHGKEFIASRSSGKNVSGPLQKLPKEGGTPQKGAIVFWPLDTNQPPQAWFRQIFTVLQGGATAVIIPASDNNLKGWDALARSRPLFQRAVVGAARGDGLGGGIERDVLLVKPEAAQQLAALPEGAAITLETKLGEPRREYTYNAVGILHGTDQDADQDVILLTAHLDHLGQGAPGNGTPPLKDAAGKVTDDIYNGACDDASGTVAVLELARAIAAGPKPKRTVVFALFGAEELGGLGSTHFLSHSPVPLASITANLEFEMLAWPDPKLQPDVLWITGHDRSDFADELKKHGANVVADPYPEQNFFQRSDNYVLAKKGVVAQTIGSYGLQKEYHSPQDDLAHVQWEHYTRAVDSLIKPVVWLVNSDFKPQWKPGQKP